MKSYAISSLLFFSMFCADAETLGIECRLFGLHSETQTYQTIAKGALSVDVSQIADKPDAAPFIQRAEEKYPNSSIYIPLGERSQLFGEEGGTRLQISVWVADKTPDKPYAFQVVTLNGLRIHSSIYLEREHSRMILNTDRLDNPALVSAPSEEDLISEQSPLTLPEGVFDFLYSDCKVNWPDRESLNPAD